MANERQPLLDVERAEEGAPSSSSSSRKQPAAEAVNTSRYAAMTTLAVLAVVGFVAVQMRGGFSSTVGFMNMAGTAPAGTVKVSPMASSKSSSSSSSSKSSGKEEKPASSSSSSSSSSESEEETATESDSTDAEAETTTATSKSAGEAVVKYTELDSDTKKNLFRDFKINYNKAYKDSKEESFRMQQFDSFLERVDKINAMQIATGGEGVVHGVTKFADYTQDEFAKMFMGFVPADAETKKTRMEKQKAITVHPTSSSKSSVDWTGVYTTSVNDQDRCASSWAWSASQQIESDAIRLGLIPLSDAFKLSPQQILDCDAADAGCDGGNTHTAFETVFKVLNSSILSSLFRLLC